MATVPWFRVRHGISQCCRVRVCVCYCVSISVLLCARVHVLLRKQYMHLGVFPSEALKTCSAKRDGGLPAVKWGSPFLLQSRWMESLGPLLPGHDKFVDVNEEAQDSAVSHSVLTQLCMRTWRSCCSDKEDVFCSTSFRGEGPCCCGTWIWHILRAAALGDVTQVETPSLDSDALPYQCNPTDDISTISDTMTFQAQTKKSYSSRTMPDRAPQMPRRGVGETLPSWGSFPNSPPRHLGSSQLSSCNLHVFHLQYFLHLLMRLLFNEHSHLYPRTVRISEGAFPTDTLEPDMQCEQA